MVLQKLLRAGEGKIVRRLKAIADAVNDIEDDIKALSDAELRAETETFKLSTDPNFVAKLRDVVGLHVSPPEHASFCVWMRSPKFRPSTAPSLVFRSRKVVAAR